MGRKKNIDTLMQENQQLLDSLQDEETPTPVPVPEEQPKPKRTRKKKESVPSPEQQKTPLQLFDEFFSRVNNKEREFHTEEVQVGMIALQFHSSKDGRNTYTIKTDRMYVEALITHSVEHIKESLSTYNHMAHYYEHPNTFYEDLNTLIGMFDDGNS